MHETLTIGTRASELALIQAQIVKGKLQRRFPRTRFAIKTFKCTGDKILHCSLVKIGGKGLFIKELEEKLLTGEIDLAIHSMKDVPAQMNDEFCIPAILKRNDFQDCFLSSKYNSLSEFPDNVVIGTCSPRRKAQLLWHFDLQSHDLRGNINTRLQKMNQFDGIILAKVALQRLKKTEYIKENLSIDKFLPAGGQGAIGIQCLKYNIKLMQKLQKINHKNSYECLQLERIFLRELHADCHVPVGILVQKKSDLFTAKFEVFNNKNERIFCQFAGNFFKMKRFLQINGQKLKNYII